MKIIYNINKFVFIVTLILYLTIILGLYAQIVLGGIQIICALTLFLKWQQFPNKIKERLTIYWTLVLIYGICWLFEWNSFETTLFFVLSVIVIPMSIAGYFLHILYSIYKYMS